MAETGNSSFISRNRQRSFWSKLKDRFSSVPMLGWLLGALIAVVLERLIGLPFARALGMSKMPALFGIILILDKPLQFPSAFLYVLTLYVAPICLFCFFTASLTNRWVAKLLKFSTWFTVLLHIGLLYAVLHIWATSGDYHLLVARLIMIAIIVTLSLNVVNGYMGEFSCSHPGFMAIGAYVASVFSVALFTDSSMFGPALLPKAIGPFLFPLILLIAGGVSALSAILIAVPSFRTRGDYLAVVSLAFMFIIKSLFENLEVVGGPRGLGGQPNWASLPVVFVSAVISIWVINNFVRSTLGKGLNAVRDDETAAGAMTVNTRHTKMTAFLFAAFWAGVAGGLFAHVIRYVNPGTFGVTMLAEVLAMVYFGGLNSVVGSIFGAVSINMLSEALRPLEIYKWIIIPLMLILVMIFRPTGLFAFREFDILHIIQPKNVPEHEVGYATAAD